MLEPARQSGDARVLLPYEGRKRLGRRWFVALTLGELVGVRHPVARSSREWIGATAGAAAFAWSVGMLPNAWSKSSSKLGWRAAVRLVPIGGVKG